MNVSGGLKIAFEFYDFDVVVRKINMKYMVRGSFVSETFVCGHYTYKIFCIILKSGHKD